MNRPNERKTMTADNYRHNAPLFNVLADLGYNVIEVAECAGQFIVRALGEGKQTVAGMNRMLPVALGDAIDRARAERRLQSLKG